MTLDKPLSNLAASIRYLKRSTNDSTSACSWVRHQLPDHFAPPDKAKELEARWVQHASTYEDIVDDSKIAATKLSATMTMYTSLQTAFMKAKPEDVVHELASLRKAVSAMDASFVSRLDILRNAMEEFLRAAEIARASRRRMSSEHSPDRSHPGWVESATSTLRGVGLHLLWTPLLYVGGLMLSTSVHDGRGEKEVSAAAGAFDEDATSPEQVLSSIRDLIRKLEQQKTLFGALQDIKDELMSEFDRYAAALQAPGDEQSHAEAIRRAHADTVSRASQWKEIARVLAEEYARA